MLPQNNKELKEKIERINQPGRKKEKETYVRGVFDSIAKFYDLMNSLMSFGMHSYWRKYAVRKLGIFPGAVVMDGCTGTADFALASARVAGAKGRVAAFDFSSGMLASGRHKVEGKPISLTRANALYPPYKENTFDFATVGCGIRNLADIDYGLRQILRVLKPGGKFGCLDLGRPFIPGYAQLYYFYFFRVVPCVGKLVADDYEAYSYLPNSLHTFPKQEELQDKMQKAGFKNVHYINLAGGAMALHIGQKPS